MIETLQEAIAYLTPIAESASLPNYQRALRMVLDVANAKLEQGGEEPNGK